jgi:hypothetical protein
MITFDTNLSAMNATTQYLNFEYDSMVKFENKFLCASASGLFEITGNTDDEEDIESYFEIATLDFGISNQKRLRAIYVGYEADGDISLKISTELSSVQTYTLPATIFGQHARKVVISRCLKGRYWTFQVYASGIIFSIDSISVLPIIRGHGFDQN